MNISHRGMDATGSVSKTFFEVISKKNCPFYGGAAIVCGGILAAVVFYPTTKR
jgi:hypothetical protein